MRRTTEKDKRLAFVATILLLLAIPISLVGVDQVNDIRNRAEEEVALLAFETDLTSEEVTTAYVGIPYQQQIQLSGDFEQIATLQLGCDEGMCGSICDDLEHAPPSELLLADDGRTILWENPAHYETTVSWPITLSMTAPSSDDTGEYECVAESFTLSLETEVVNTPPSCTLHTSQKLKAVPEESPANFILEGIDHESGIASAKVTALPIDGTFTPLEWTFDDTPETILLNKDSDPPLSISMEQSGSYTLSAEVADADGLTGSCDMPGGHQLTVVIPGDNGSPVFDTDPYNDSRPSTTLTTGQSYTYTAKGTDPTGDDIDYFVINKTGWLNFSLNSNSEGSFEGTFSGTPTAAGSYTVVIALNDGFHNHYTTQIWVINVDSATNDTPQVTVTLPEAGSTIQQNQSTKIQWTATDDNLITNFDVFLTIDPTNNDAMVPLATGLGYNYDSYMWNTGSTPTGTYYVVVKATDNQEPSATGVGISGAFGIGITPTGDPTPSLPPSEQPEPEVVESYPTITSINPRDKSETKDTQPIISADLTASDGATIETRTVTMSLDDEDISSIAILRGGDEHDGSLLYTPGRPLSFGSHKVSVTFEDSSGETVTKTWTFTITDEQDDTPSDDDSGDEETISIFGIEIPRRIAFIVGIGLILLLIALIVPWLFYAAWRRSKDDEWEDPNLPGPRDPGGQPRMSPAGPDDIISGISAQPRETVDLEEPPKPPEEPTEENVPPVSPPPTTPEPSSPQPLSEPAPAGQPPITPSDASPDEELAQAFKQIAEEEHGGLPPAEPGLAEEDKPLPPKPPLQPSDMGSLSEKAEPGREDLDPKQLTR